jgi:hypothetical protein
MTRGRAVCAARWGVAVWCGLAATACSDTNRVADRVSCYPACLADIVLGCPMLSACDTTAGTNPLISDADIATGVSACFASGERRWEATNATTNDSVVVVKHADGSECYTATSPGASMRYTISVGGQNVAELNADTPGAPAAVTCNGTTTTIQENTACLRLPWTSAMVCQQLPCDFGAIPAGAVTGATNAAQK